MKDLILAIDIGNTSIHLGVFAHPLRQGNPKLIARENILIEQAVDFLNRWQKRRDKSPFTSSRITSSVKIALMASTRPESNTLIEHWVKEVFGIKPLRVREDFRIPMPVLVDEPSKVGADRLLNAFAAYHLTKKLTLVIDFGTAITLDIVSKKGEFLGGVIMPGITSMARSLHQDCALLPLLSTRRVGTTIGKNTEQAMQAGLYLGTIGSIKYLVQRISKEPFGKGFGRASAEPLRGEQFGSERLDRARRGLTAEELAEPLKKRPYIIATGSDAELMKPGLPFIKQIIPDLTLQGLILAYLA